MSRLIAHHPPTHILAVEIPLRIDVADELDFDPFQDALKVVLALGRAAFAGSVCDDPQVTVEERSGTRS